MSAGALRRSLRRLGSSVPRSNNLDILGAGASENLVQDRPAYGQISRSEGASGFPHVNARYRPDEHNALPALPPLKPAVGASKKHWEESWSTDDLQAATEAHVMLTWGATGPAFDLPRIVRGKGVYVYDEAGRKFLDWTSQAVCCNFGHDVPDPVLAAVNKQLRDLPYIYGGMGVVPVRSRLSKILAELMPGDISGFLFPCGGAEANEAAIRIARRFTGRQKILTQYRSYHGGTAHSLGATGDFRRWFTEIGVNGFVKIFNPQPMGFTWGTTDQEVCAITLRALEEQILVEGPGSIAAIMLESIVGAGGVLIPPVGYMEGVRALCDKYNILLILDEVMAGFGRTGELWAFQHFDGVLPDIITSAKGLTGAFLPMAMVGMREKIKTWFHTQPLGWGATYHAHPVAMACAYECVKFMIAEKLPQRSKALQGVMMEEIQRLVERHECVKQGRAVGLFGCIDLQAADGRSVQQLGMPAPAYIQDFRRALSENGLMALFRPPLLHCCPPLTITEEELRDGFARLSCALTQLDASIAAHAAWGGQYFQ